MKKKILVIISILLISLSAGLVYMTQFHSSTGLDRKEEKIIKHGFRLLEEQIGTYIKENYSGISKIEFSPIYVTGDEDSSMLNAYVRPTIYDKYGNKATLGTQIKKYVPNSFGIVTDLIVDFDWDGNEVIELFDSDDERIDVSNAKKLPKEAKLRDAESIDINIEMVN